MHTQMDRQIDRHTRKQTSTHTHTHAFTLTYTHAHAHTGAWTAAATAQAHSVEQRQLLSWLPPPLLAQVLQPLKGVHAEGQLVGEAQSGSSTHSGIYSSSHSSSNSSDAVGLHWAAWAAARLLVERSVGGEGDASARVQWARALAVQAQVCGVTCKVCVCVCYVVVCYNV